MAQVASAQILLEAAGGNAVLRELQDVDSSLNRLTRTGDSASSGLGSFGSAVLGGAVVAGAQMAVGALASLGSGIMGIVGQAFQASAAYEAMAFSLQSLAARELVATGQAASVGAAFDQAGGMAQSLLRWTQRLAIQSPFSQEGVTQAFKMAMNYGFMTDEAKRLTEITLDWAAATGAGTFEMQRATLALGQMRQNGKVSLQDLRQLTDAGVPAMQYLMEAFDMTGAELQRAFMNGSISAQDAIDAITTAMDRDFGGAGQRMTNTLGGLMSSLGDIKDMGLRELFGGIFETASPALASFATSMMENVVPALDDVGRLLGDTIEPAMSNIATYIGPVLSLAAAFAQIATGDSVSGMQTLQSAVMDIGSALGMDTSDILTLVQNISKLATGDFTPLTDLIPPELLSSAQTLGSAFDDVFTAFESTAPAAGVGFQSFIDTLSNTVLTTAPQTITNISTALSMMADWWTANGPMIIAAATGIANVLVTVLGGAFSLLSGIVTGAMQLLNGDLTGAFATLLSSFDVFANAVLGLMGTSIEEVRATWSNVWSMLGTIVSTVMDQVSFAISFRMGLIKTFIVGGIADAKNAVSHTIDSWVDLGRQLIDSIVAGITNTASALYGTISNIMKSAINAAINALQIGSPSKPFLEMGMNIATSFGLGAEKEAPTAQASIAGMAQGAINSAGAALPATGGGGGGGTTNNVTFTVLAQSFDDIVREAAARGYEFAKVA